MAKLGIPYHYREFDHSRLATFLSRVTGIVDSLAEIVVLGCGIGLIVEIIHAVSEKRGPNVSAFIIPIIVGIVLIAVNNTLVLLWLVKLDIKSKNRYRKKYEKEALGKAERARNSIPTTSGATYVSTQRSLRKNEFAEDIIKVSEKCPCCGSKKITYDGYCAKCYKRRLAYK